MDLYPVTNASRLWGLSNSIVKIDQLAVNITYKQFSEIKNNITMPQDDTLCLFKQLCNQVYRSSDSIALDEMLTKFYGKFKFKQHMPKKPAKIGLKTFILGCSDLKIPIDYVFHDDKMPRSDDTNLIDGMVFEVIKRNKEDKMIKDNTTLYTDNYFTTHWLQKKA